MAQRCIMDTKEVRDLSQELDTLAPIIKANIVLWQEDNNKDMDTFPTAKELAPYIEQNRRKDRAKFGEKLTDKITLIEHNEGNSWKESYKARTIKNIESTDITLAFAYDYKSPEELLVRKNASKKVYVTGPMETVDFSSEESIAENATRIANRALKEIKRKGLDINNLKINIAGNELASFLEGVSEKDAEKLIASVLEKIQDKEGLRITEVYTGGQSGVSIAGARASGSLGIKTIIRAPKGFLISNKEGKTKKGRENYLEEIGFQDRTTPLSFSQKVTQDFFESTRVTSVQEDRGLSRTFTPMQIKNRTRMLSKMFSSIITLELNKKKQGLQKTIDQLIKEEKLKEANAFIEELKGLSRSRMIDILSPAEIFKQIYKEFYDYLSMPMNDRVSYEFTNLRNNPKADKFSDERLMQSAKKRAELKSTEFTKIIQNFNALSSVASNQLAISEKVSFKPNGRTVSETYYQEALEDQDSDLKNKDVIDEEEGHKESWMTNYKHISARESLSEDVRHIINNIPRLNHKGQVLRDDLGFIQYLDGDYVHATLVDALRNMTSSEDMMPLLEKMAEVKKWINPLILELEKDNTILSQFYQNYRLDFVNYEVVIKRKNTGGYYTLETKRINNPESLSYLLDEWRDTYESGMQLSDNSIYNKDLTMNKEVAKKNYDRVTKLQRETNNLTLQELFEYLTKEKVTEINDLLKGLGIAIEDDLVSLVASEKRNTSTDKSNTITLLKNMNIIYKGVKDGEVKTQEREDGSPYTEDLMTVFQGAYGQLAELFAEVKEDAIESSVRENGKSYYSHVVPGYLTKTIKRLKNVLENDAKFAKYIEEEFGQYEWFKKDGKFLNYWVELLTDKTKGKEFRKLLDHKVVLNYDKKEYSDWSDVDYQAVILAEYTSDPKGNSAWYYVPIPSDAPSSEFIRFVRHSRNKKYTVDKKTVTYDQFIVDKLTNLVQQEYDRIMTVRERFNKNKAGAGIKTIKNYDIKTDIDGNIVEQGGGEFKFLPALNDYQVEGFPATESDSSIIRFLSERGKTKEGALKLKQELREILSDVMEQEFEDEYNKMRDSGLLDSEEGSKKYALIDSVNQEGANKILTTTLESINHVLSKEGKKEASFLLNRINNNKPITTKRIQDALDLIKQDLQQAIENNPKLSNAIKNAEHRLVYNNPGKELLREFHYNNTLAQSQIIQLATTDLAFYKDLEEFQKRFKQVHSPSRRLNTEATYNGEKVGRKIERSITLQDQYLVSNTYENVVETIQQKVSQGYLTEAEMIDILSKYTANNVTDGQSFRTLSSYRRVMVMQGDWNDAKEAAYKNFLNNTWDANDFDIIWQTKKPFVYSQISKNDGQGNLIKVPVQHKNSEFLLLALAPYMSGDMAKSGKLKALNTWMEANDVDVVHFDSVVKVGLQGVINLNTKEPSVPTTIEVKGNKIEFASIDKLQGELAKLIEQGKITQEDLNTVMEDYRVDSYEDTMDILTEVTGLKNTNHLQPQLEQGDPDVVHEIPYEDYGIQTSTPEYIFDKLQAMGTQIRKLITADISPDAVIEINGVEHKPIIDKISGEVIESAKDKIIKEYHSLITQNIIESFQEVNSRFQSIESVEAILMEELESSDRYGDDLKQACKLVEQVVYKEDGTQTIEKAFNLPLFDPVQSIRIQQLLYSVIKNTITKQRFKGGSAIQVTSYGMDKNLQIVYDKDSNGNKKIKHIECMMPWYTERLFEPFMKEGSHEIDINKIPEDLKKLIGYRVPTEDKYSMVPLYIKGFTPRQNGSVIMLPTEITTLSGADFDVDKLYILMPEFDIQRYDVEAMRKDFHAVYDKTQSPGDKTIITDLLGVEEVDSDYQEEWEVFQENNKERYLLDEPIISKVQYDSSKSVAENSLRQRNNRILDIMWGILTSSDTTSKILKGGNYDYQKRASRIITLLENMSRQELMDLFNTKDLTTAIKKAEKLSIKELNQLTEKHITQRNPLSLSNQIYLHQQNMIGNLLIGVYANHNVHHAIAQHGEFSTAPIINLNGKVLTNLSALQNEEKSYISNLIAGYLAASVDNAKDPVLLALNQNGTTANAAMLLIRLGYNPIEVGLLFKQPIIMDLTKGLKDSRENIIDAYESRRNKLIKLLRSWNVEYKKSYSHKDVITTEELAASIAMKTELNSNDTHTLPKADAIKYTLTQLKVLEIYKDLHTQGGQLGDIVAAHRSDTGKGSIGPTIGHTLEKQFRIADMLEEQMREDYPFYGANLIDFNIKDLKNLKLLLENGESPVSYMQAFYTLGINASQDLMKTYFPVLNKPFIDQIHRIRSYTQTDYLDAATMNGIINEMLAYYMTKTEFFGSDKNLNALEKRKMFLEEFPSYYERFMKDPKNASIAELPFFKQLKVVKPGKYNPIQALLFKNVGKLSKEKRDSFMRDWESLLYMKNANARKLAVDIARYYFYRNGFGFGPNNATHLIPTNVKLAIPEYREALMDLQNDKEWVEFDYFAKQYMRNHLNNRRLVKQIDSEYQEYVVDENDEALDKIELEATDIHNPLLGELLKKEFSINKMKAILPRNYFTIDVNNSKVYYELQNVSESGDIIFAKINPVGYKNNALEYEWGKDASLLETAISPKQDKSIDSKYANEEVGDFYGQLYNEAYDSQLSYLNEIIDTDRAVESMGDKAINLDNLDSVPRKDANNLESC